MADDLQLEHEYETVKLYRRGEGEARLVMARPDSLNAWNAQLGYDLSDAVKRTGEDASVRAVVLTGEGRAFSSGADLKSGFDDFTPAGNPDVGKALRERYHPIILGLRTMPKPVLAAINGPAVGIGCSAALACDLLVAKESAYLLLAFVNIGLVPDGGSSLFVPSRAGMARAMEMAMLGEKLPAAQALAWGLVNRVVPDDEFDATVDALAERLATGPTASFAGSKRQINAWLYGGRMQEQLELEAQIQEQMAASQDMREGILAFVQKRQPAFTGR